jgi:hypothetical protein
MPGRYIWSAGTPGLRRQSLRGRTKDNARRGAARSHDGVRGRSVALARQLNPRRTPQPSRSLVKLSLVRGTIMQELEIFDLGDAMLETRCANITGAFMDYLFGPHRYTC